MKKTVKIISTILLVVMLVATVSGTAMAFDVNSTIDQVQNGGKDVKGDEIANLGGQIVSIIQIVGIVVAIVILLIIGIKYLTSSAEGKAEYKKTMIPYLVGAVLVFAGTSIVIFM